MTIAERLKREGEKRGLKKGIEKVKIEMAKNLLATGDSIAKISGLPVSKIKTLMR